MTAPPIPCQWSGDSFEPLKRFSRECDKHFTIGEVYTLIVSEPRSQRSHSHFFASVQDAWMNLPEHLAERWATSEHLRKWALIKAGYHNHRQFVTSSKAEAVRLAAFIKPCDEYAIVTVSECVVNVFTAQSQSHKAMGAKAFQESKAKVLDILAALIGVAVPALQRNAGDVAA